LSSAHLEYKVALINSKNRFFYIFPLIEIALN